MQLTVPVLAAAGGVIFIGETITLRLVVAAAVVLGGTALALVGRERSPEQPAALTDSSVSAPRRGARGCSHMGRIALMRSAIA